MDVTSVVVDANATVGNNLMLVGVSPAYSYENGKRTDTVVAFKYSVVMPTRLFEKLSVRIDGERKLPDIKDGETPVVLFDDLKISIYWSPQGHRISATANDIRLANPPKKIG